MQGKRIEGNFKQGWGVVLLVVLLAIVLNAWATQVHFAHYQPGNAVGHRGGEQSRADNAPMGH